VFTPLPRSPRAALLALTTFGLTAGGVVAPVAAQAANHAHRTVQAHSAARDAAEREARVQEREALRATRLEEREAARTERQTLREQRRADRAQERVARREGRHEGGKGTSGTNSAGEPSSSSSTTSSASTRGCHVTIQTSAPRILAGESVTVFGKVTCPAGNEPGGETATASANSAAGGQQLTIEQSERDHGTGIAHALAATQTVTTEPDGSYQLSLVTLDANTVFRVHLGRHGAHTGVRVAPVVTLNAPTPEPAAAQPASAGGRERQARRSKLVFTGTVSPAAPGARVALQVSYPADGEQWHTIAYGQVTEGGFSIVHSLRIPGEAKLRVLAHPKGANSPGASEAIAYNVPQPQNPQLTIESSANPILAGQTVTLSGVAAGAAGQTVTLLARSKGGAFAPVATSTTDESGAYSFADQAPQQNTYYEVSDATTHSVALFLGVKYALTLNTPPATVATGEALTIAGSVAPARAGASVLLERGGPSGLGFHPIASSTVNADGSFTLAHTFASATSAKLRVRIANDPQNLGAASAPFTVSISAGPAATLAPEPVAPTS